ncbi:MAG: 1,4-dihydroxy-2-naphthoate polyprenyltransferase [Deltaproteobacteria bacterium]|nr:1,4-dihydroxy-2-naphthoate polyprenyltransferase [Deltaproteobacteria bacterium]
MPAASPPLQLHPLKIWWLAARPATLTAALAPLAVGGALAWRDHVADPLAWLAALVGALLIQLGTNFANDVFDYEKGADTAERKGPLRVTQAGLVTPAAVKRAMILAFGLAVLCGSYLVWRCGMPVVYIGLASVAAGVLYTGGPWPLGYLGLGDVFVFAFFGVVAVVGTYFVQAATVSADAILWSLPVGASCTAILVVNNLRDAETDVLVGKRTLAVRWGATAVRVEYFLMAAAAVGVPVGLAVRDRAWPLALPVLALPAVVRSARTVWRHSDGPTLNGALGSTARWHLLVGLLAALGLGLQRGLA